MKRTIRIFDTIDEQAEGFAALLTQRFTETPLDHDFSWVLSGGSTPAAVFRKIAFSCRDTIDWSRVKIFWGDERCVGPGDRESNYKMARENLLDHVPIPSSRIFRIRGEVNPVLEAARYAEVCHQHIGRHEGVPQADLIMLGLGEDGHTASVFPSDISLFGSDKLFEVALHPGTSQQRITMTGKVINQAKLVVFLATGESKAARVAQVINRLSGWDLLPASMVSPEYGELTWLLDHGAASRLNSV